MQITMYVEAVEYLLKNFPTGSDFGSVTLEIVSSLL